MKTVEEIMSKDCITLSGSDTIQTAAQLMKQHDFGFIPILENSKMIGVVTDRDVVIRGIAEGKGSETSINEVMSEHHIITAPPTMTTVEASELMAKEKIRRLPVVQDGELLGIVAVADLATSIPNPSPIGEAISEISEDEPHQSSTH